MVSLTMFTQVWILLLTLIDPSASLSRDRDIYLGLYSGNASDTLRVYNKPYDSLLCYDFTPGNSTTEQCKFYGDCCVDPMRIRDRLEPGTFSCQTTPGYTGELVYVVDKCPSLTADKQLVTSCQETETGSSFAMATWPVTAKRTGLLYKNIFCALCHGVLAERDISLNSTINSKSVDFWWLSVNCEMQTISKLTEEYETFTVASLEPHINNGECGLRFSPPSQPHRCLDAVRSCPANFTDLELKLLCEQGPVSYTRAQDSMMYRNYFCQMCHGQVDGHPGSPGRSGIRGGPEAQGQPGPKEEAGSQEIDGQNRAPDLPSAVRPPGNPRSPPSSGFRWPYPLIEIQPQMQLDSHIHLSPDNYLTNVEPHNVSIKHLALTNNILDSYEYSVNSLNPPTNSSWNFGSLLCESLFKGICDKVISRPRSGCGGPGCGVNSWQDANSTCYELSNYNYDLSSRQQAEYIWPHSLYGRYSSSCNPEADVHPDWWGVNCRCDSRCHYFDECCFDTPLPENYIHHHQTLKYSCVAQQSCETRHSFAIISTCLTGSDIILRQLCYQGEIGDWSPVGWTVYDSKTNLSYKNVYCALCNDVPAERVKFWQAYFECHKNETTETNATEGENINNLEWLGECSFIRFIPKEPEIAYTCYNPPTVSSCPRHLADWKIAYDCVNEPTSWVSYNQTLYRNAYCAICNLDDGIMESNIHPKETYFALQARAAESLFGDTTYRPPDSVILDVSGNKCCYRNECMLNTYSSSEQSPWGKIGQGNSSKCLVRLPFDTKCEDNDFVSPDNKPPNLFYLCSGSFQPLPEDLQGCSGVKGESGGPGPITPSFTKLIFTDFGDIPLTHTLLIDTEWIEVNDSLLLCSNGTNLITTTGELYSKLRLSPSKIEVKQKFITETFDGLSLETYDYILLSLSLLSLSVYIIYIPISRKRMSLNLPEMMKLSILISLFGALLCYSLTNIPAGKDLIGCQSLAVMQQFLFLSTFTWTSAFGINITQIIYTMQPPSSSTKRFLQFAAYAVGLPITMVMTTFTLSEFQENIAAFKSPVYRVYGICFLHETYIIIALFLAPIYIIVSSNVIVCVMCMVRVCKSSGITTHDKDRWKKNILTCIKLSGCMGLAWILLFFDPLGSQSLDLGFRVLVETQGLLIVATNVISWGCIRKSRKYADSGTSTTAVTSTAVSGMQSVELSSQPTSGQPKV